MPEMPEVENIALGLRAAIVGKRIGKVRVETPAMIRGPYRRRWRRFLDELAGRRIERVARRAKRLILAPEGDLALVFQLGMTGKFLLPAGGAGQRHQHTRLTMAFGDGSELHFVDMRRFGRLWCLRDLDPDDPDATLEAAGMTPLGPEALSLRGPAFEEALCTQRAVKALLLDQTRIAGLGNIYADESLWAAGVHPARAAGTLTGEQAGVLLRQIKNVLRRAIRAGGTTFSDFRNAYGDMGRFRRRLKVYQRHGEPCKRCGETIERLVVAGRGTHVCPRCQRP
ncbi:MAG: bifunctional DNA-formamidopyrimidine glycosylase/DNA-(apurinic or apyrimidinic site) lyase [Sedimentisphaerales bacterium]|nr:bifunctional DNA-formamidopyrimidine glycosylase/DNA-(apurinic or apyrimidinic site) lyase [Sedimentisphaerales bacterium]